MAYQYKYYQVTNQILLRYGMDYQNIIKLNYNKTYLNNYVNSEYQMYYAKNGNQCLLEIDGDNNNNKQGKEESDHINNYKYTKFVNLGNNSYYYPGISSASNYDVDEIASNYCGSIIPDMNGRSVRKSVLMHDSIRIYLMTGYLLDSVGGLSIQVKGHVTSLKYVSDTTYITKVKRVDEYLTLLDWFMPKQLVRENIQWIEDGPLYLNSKFYDRYIDIYFPSPIYCAMYSTDVYFQQTVNNNIYYGNINPNSDVMLYFKLVDESNLSLVDTSSTDYASTFVMTSPIQIGIRPNSSSDYINVRIYEDLNNRYVVYYPVYGLGDNAQDIDIDVMNSFESGNILLSDDGAYNDNKYMAEFLEIYGEDADTIRHYYIINELAVQYNYYYITTGDLQLPTTDPDYTNREIYSNTIDYTDKTSEHGQFWRTKWIPVIKDKLGMTCRSITLKYSMRLVNRFNYREVVKIATLTITNPSRYKQHTININSINTFKVINQTNTNEIVFNQTQQVTTPKYIKSYYDATEITVKDPDSDVIYTQGQLTLKLRKTGANYMLKVYTVNTEGTRIPYNMTGTYKYKLVFPSIDGERIEISPSDDTNTNFGIGCLMFYISADNSRRVMAVPSSERYFALITDVDQTQDETSLYEGKVDYYS